MMDIVERLRKHEIHWAIFKESADEIERLREALQTLTDKCLTDFDGGRKLRRGDVEKARSALQQKDSE